MNKTGLIAKISMKYVLPTCIWKYLWRISRHLRFFLEFCGILQKNLNFTGPQPREISEALQRVNMVLFHSIKIELHCNKDCYDVKYMK